MTGGGEGVAVVRGDGVVGRGVVVGSRVEVSLGDPLGAGDVGVTGDGVGEEEVGGTDVVKFVVVPGTLAVIVVA